MPDLPPDDIDVPPPQPKPRSSMPALAVACGLALLAVAAVAGTVLLLLLPGRAQVRQERELTACRSNQEEVARGCGRHAAEWGEFPLRLESLCPKHVKDRSALRCPATGEYYAYLRGRNPMLADFVLAHCPAGPGHAGRGFHLLRVDGSVELWSGSRRAELDALIADQNAVLAAVDTTPEAAQRAMEEYRRKHPRARPADPGTPLGGRGLR